MIMPLASWTLRYGFHIVLNENQLPKRSQVEGVLQEMKELSICGAN